jgi:hypothetical protein
VVIGGLLLRNPYRFRWDQGYADQFPILTVTVRRTAAGLIGSTEVVATFPRYGAGRRPDAELSNQERQGHKTRPADQDQQRIARQLLPLDRICKWLAHF